MRKGNEILCTLRSGNFAAATAKDLRQDWSAQAEGKKGEQAWVVPNVTNRMLLPSVIQLVRIFCSSIPFDVAINLSMRNTKVVELFQTETLDIQSCR